MTNSSPSRYPSHVPAEFLIPPSDLFVTSYFMSMDEVARSYQGLPTKQETLKRSHLSIRGVHCRIIVFVSRIILPNFRKGSPIGWAGILSY
jgi:hypothetical protein